ncbi:FliI/YscN family ATPase [Novosphingobium sp. B 225]|uniref:FliI/YscN family ATPase n=1 Tax=Novosphingobium sp. B 225 TaxID=1961849 RepID=UPI000B4A6087|nr:FliI/YscN family ATPase [Novosphingobium sp. B 225]
MMPHPVIERLRQLDTVGRQGRLLRILPSWLEADGPNVALGSLCEIGEAEGLIPPVVAEVVKVDHDHIALVPYGETAMLAAGAPVRALAEDAAVPVGDGFSGRAIDALARPIDGQGPIAAWHKAPLFDGLPEPLERATPREPLVTGIRALDGLLTLGKGQRIGIFAASGVGKTSLIAQLARQAEADRLVLCLVGERGREVEQLWNEDLPADVRARTTMVAATSDKPAALRIRAVYQALALARHWRARGEHVLLVLDSATRLAMAMRENGLAAGEPPTVRAYPPSVFSAIPRVIEHCGALTAGGAISAVFTVLSESDEVDDPICEMMKSLLDGHIVLSRAMAERGQFPAVDIARSVSRNMHRLVSAQQLAHARKVLGLIATYEESRTLIESGLYSAGSSLPIDAAIAAKSAIDAFLAQPQDECAADDATRTALASLAGGAG